MTYIEPAVHPKTMGKRTQDLIFTLYGDYLRYRGSSAWIGSLIQILGTLGTSEQAVRSTMSRMARKGWLESTRRGRHSIYSLTPKSERLLAEGTQQIFFPQRERWDGHWYLVTYAFSDEMGPARHRLRKRLSWLGFGQLTNGTLVSPRNLRAEVHTVLDELHVQENVNYFRAEDLLLTDDASLARRCWDLDELAASYQEFIAQYQPRFERDRLAEDQGDGLTPEHAFQQRFWLVHEYRTFPFEDPYLPQELLPADWPGYAAMDLFQAYYALLGDAANEYIDQVLDEAPDVSPVRSASGDTVT